MNHFNAWFTLLLNHTKTKQHMMTKFNKSSIHRLDHSMNRAPIEIQRLKICYSCRKGFCKRKGRAKAAAVFNQPGRYVCQKCANDLMSGKSNNRVTIQ